jgi:hypothetical protein
MIFAADAAKKKGTRVSVERVKARIMEKLADESARTNAIIYGTWRASVDVQAIPRRATAYPAR